MSRESYWDYMGRKMREDRVKSSQPTNDLVTLFNRIETLEKRVVTLEGHLEKISASNRKTPWRPNPLDG